MLNSHPLHYLVLIASTLVFQSFAEAKMYRWVDENGRVFYSDKVPPQQSKRERNVLNDKGLVVDTVKAAKTQEQIDLEKRLNILRQEQEKIIARQKSNDKVLLSTFRNMDDLRMTLEGKLQSVDAQKHVHERTLENLQENLASARKKAALAERKGNKVPDAVLNEIATIEEKISSTYLEIAKTHEKRVSIQQKFDKDIERFHFLTKNSRINAQDLSNETAEITAANVLGLYNCKDQKSCNQAWEVAKQFVIQNSTTPINFNTDALIMGSDPVNATDLSLSASKSIRSNNKVSIFLDIRCHSSTLGQEFCQSNKVKNIRGSFQSYIDSSLK